MIINPLPPYVKQIPDGWGEPDNITTLPFHPNPNPPQLSPQFLTSGNTVFIVIERLPYAHTDEIKLIEVFRTQEDAQQAVALLHKVSDRDFDILEWKVK